METRPFYRVLIASAVMFFGGATALAYLIFTVYPVLWARWAFFAALTFTVTGATMPLAAYLHRRFPGAKPTSEHTVLREGLFAGLYVGTLAWLQLGRALSPVSAAIPAVALLAIEALLLLNDAARKG